MNVRWLLQNEPIPVVDRGCYRIGAVFGSTNFFGHGAGCPGQRSASLRNLRSSILRFIVLAPLAAGPWLLGSCRRLPDIPETWDLPADFAEHQSKITTLVLPPKVTRFDWLSDDIEHLAAPGSAATVVRGFPGHLQSLDLSYSEVRFLAGLPKGLKELDLRFTNLTKVPDLPDGITRLALGGGAISTYEGIPSDLRELTVEEAPQLGVLYGLPRKLQSLTLIGTSFTDLRGLPPNLQTLTLKWTGVKTLVDVPDSIQTLVLEGNPQLEIGDDLPPFLTVLTVKGSTVPDLSHLTYLVELEIDRWDPESQKVPRGLRTLRLDGVTIPPDVRELPSLRTLSILGGDLAETSALPPRLERIELQGSRLPDLKAVPPQWSSLRHLDLSWTGLTQLPPLPPTLESLDLSATGIVDLTGLTGTLSTLRFHRSMVTELTGLPNSLRELDLADSKDLNRIGGQLPALRILNLRGSAFVSLAELPRTIRVLDISDTGIASLQGVPPSLEELTICRGQMASLADLPESVHTLRFLVSLGPEKIEP